MDGLSVGIRFDPLAFKAYSKNEGYALINITSKDNPGTYWCEFDVTLKSPLSLAPDKELDAGRTRVGIIKPGSSIERKIRIYTRPNNYPDSYPMVFTFYMYGEDGAIAERIEKREEIPCLEAKNTNVR